MLTDEQINATARQHGIDPCAIKAVIQVETPSPHLGDYKPGKPLILFERHIFYRMSGRYPVSRDYPHLSNPSPGGYCTGSTWRARQECEHKKLEEAMSIYDGEVRSAALKSVSMGLFQIMGFNHAVVGYPTVEDMWESYKKVDDTIDLRDFIRYCASNNLLRHLKGRPNFQAFARGYNGPAYARYGYHTKMQNAYDLCIRGRESVSTGAKGSHGFVFKDIPITMYIPDDEG